jgi:hypothetical protein
VKDFATLVFISYILYSGGVEIMKTKSGLRGLRVFLATCASVACACVCVLLIAGEYHSARFKLDTYEREYQGWEAFGKTNPAYFEANREAVSSCLRNLDEARDSFWVKLPRTQAVGLFVAAGLGSAAGAYLATWAVLWLISAGIGQFGRWLVLCFQPKPQRRPGTHPASARTSWQAGPPPASSYRKIGAGATPASPDNPSADRQDSTVRWDNQVVIRQPAVGPKCKVQN